MEGMDVGEGFKVSMISLPLAFLIGTSFGFILSFISCWAYINNYLFWIHQ